MNVLTECDKYPGRLREICRGTADLPPEKINAYRHRMGLKPFDLNDTTFTGFSKPKSLHRKPEVEKKRERKIPKQRRKGGCCGGKHRKQVRNSRSKPAAEKVALGPGSHLKQLLSKLGVEPAPNCSCNLLIEIMDDLGSVGCKLWRASLLKLMHKNQEKYGWSTYLRAGVGIVLLGWTFKINPANPIPDLFDWAVRLAEQDEL